MDDVYRPVLRDYITRIHRDGWPNPSLMMDFSRDVFHSHGYKKPYPPALMAARNLLARQINVGSTPRWIKMDHGLLAKYVEILKTFRQVHPKERKPGKEKPGRKPTQNITFHDPDHFNSVSAKLTETENTLRKYENELTNNEEMVRVQLESLKRTRMQVDMLVAELQLRNDTAEKQYSDLMKTYSNAKLIHIALDQLRKYHGELLDAATKKQIPSRLVLTTDKTPPRAAAGSDSVNDEVILD